VKRAQLNPSPEDCEVNRCRRGRRTRNIGRDGDELSDQPLTRVFGTAVTFLRGVCNLVVIGTAPVGDNPPALVDDQHGVRFPANLSGKDRRNRLWARLLLLELAGGEAADYCKVAEVVDGDTCAVIADDKGDGAPGE
jgi:hypothetical protein